MKLYEATEQAYRNGYTKGYEEGKRDAVKHGRWIDRPTAKGQVYCSECATIEKPPDSNYKSKHCPWCGAIMDAKELRHE